MELKTINSRTLFKNPTISSMKPLPLGFFLGLNLELLLLNLLAHLWVVSFHSGNYQMSTNMTWVIKLLSVIYLKVISKQKWLQATLVVWTYKFWRDNFLKQQGNYQTIKKSISTLAWFNSLANYASETVGRATSCQTEGQRLGKQNSHLENIFHVCVGRRGSG